jgi:hypothetical protein
MIDAREINELRAAVDAQLDEIFPWYKGLIAQLEAEGRDDILADIREAFEADLRAVLGTVGK